MYSLFLMRENRNLNKHSTNGMNNREQVQGHLRKRRGKIFYFFDLENEEKGSLNTSDLSDHMHGDVSK